MKSPASTIAQATGAVTGSDVTSLLGSSWQGFSIYEAKENQTATWHPSPADLQRKMHKEQGT